MSSFCSIVPNAPSIASRAFDIALANQTSALLATGWGRGTLHAFPSTCLRSNIYQISRHASDMQEQQDDTSLVVTREFEHSQLKATEALNDSVKALPSRLTQLLHDIPQVSMLTGGPHLRWHESHHTSYQLPTSKLQ